MNLLLVDSTVKDYEVFVNSVNANTTPVVYSPRTTRQELLAALNGPIDRIAVVSHTTTFIERESLFSDLNVELFRTMIETHQVKHIDYLACNTLQNPEWVEYFKKLPCVIGASNDLTGNIKYGGDWVMESTSEDIEAIYFTQSIEYYKYFLADYTDPDNNAIVYTVSGTTLVSVNNKTLASYNLSELPIDNIQEFAFFGGSLSSIRLPSTLTTIGESVFQNCTNLKSIDFPLGLNYIGINAFRNSGLISVVFPSGLNYIGLSAFSYTGLTGVTIPASVTSIGDYAFAFTLTLVSVTIENGTLTIGRGVFYDTRLTSVTIPASVTSIGNAAFYNTRLTNVTIPASVTSIGNAAFAEILTLVSLTIENGTLTIGRIAFYNTGLTSVTIPNSVTSIGSSAFNTLTSVSITDSTATQSDTFPSNINKTLYILNGTTTLQSVTPTDLSTYDLSSFSITSIGTVFDSSSWTTTSTVVIPTNATYSGTLSTNVTLYKVNSGVLTSVYPTDLSTYDLSSFSITSIGTVFQGLPLSSITLPSSLTAIVNEAFRDCDNLTTVTFTNPSITNVTIGDYAFQNCELLSTVTFPSKLISVGDYAFQNCAVTGTLTFPNLTTIGQYAFQHNKLTTVALPAASTIGNYSFSYNTTLTTVTF
jgi:hypothetical protein